MTDTNKKKLWYIIIYILISLSALTICIFIAIKREEVFDSIWYEYKRYGQDEKVYTKAMVYDFVSKILIVTPVVVSFILLHITDFILKKQSIKIYILPISIMTAYSAVFLLTLYLLRESLATTFFSAIWHILLILGLIAIYLPFKKKNPVKAEESKE